MDTTPNEHFVPQKLTTNKTYLNRVLKYHRGASVAPEHLKDVNRRHEEEEPRRCVDYCEERNNHLKEINI